MSPKSLLLAALSFSPLVASQWFSDDETENAFILYSGTVSGTFKHSSYFSSHCNDLELGSHNNSFLAVGVNPDWDSNPFFFELYHSSTEGEGGFSFTDDAIYNLGFTSAASVCMKDGHVCGTLEFDPIYKPTEMINLNKGKVEKTNLDDETGYSVSGDQSTWVSDGTINNAVDIAWPEGTDQQSNCLFEEHFVWNASTPFNYAVEFTNDSSKANLSVTAPHGNLTLNFAGDRNETPKLKYYKSVGAPIKLDTSDSSAPKFKYSNGSAVSFDEGNEDDDDGESSSTTASGSEPTTTATATSTGSGASLTSGTKTNPIPSSTETGGSGSLNAKKSMMYGAAASIVGLLAFFV